MGTGAVAAKGSKVKVHYTGWLLEEGTEFDSSYDRGQAPFEFTLGAGQVIKGWELGVAGMKVGGNVSSGFRRSWPTDGEDSHRRFRAMLT